MQVILRLWSTPVDIGSLVTTPLRLSYRGTEAGLGTGFFYERNGRTFLVTNWHVVTGRHFATLKPLSEKGTLPDRLTFLVACRGDVGEWIEASQHLYSDADREEQPQEPVWLEHAHHRHKVDVVAIPIDVPEGGVVQTIGCVNTARSMLLSVSREVFVLGYPLGIHGGRGFPIWKRASIATEPALQLDGLPKMLIDTATRQGMSGAPVIALADFEFNVEGQRPAYRAPGRVYRFVGVYSGRLGSDEMAAQLGIVWKAEVIDHIIDGATHGTSSFAL